MDQTRNYLDFEIVKENWNVYNLHDGTKMKSRNILRSAWVTKDDKGNNKYAVDVKSDTIYMCDTSLQGSKNPTKWTNEDIMKNIETSDCRYDTLSYEPEEYLLDNGTKILIHSNLTKISRTKLHNHVGDKIYTTKINISLTITPSDKQT